MAAGRVAGTGTAAEIIGDARVSVVETGAWAAAFAALEAAGLPVALAGRALRVPGATPAGSGTRSVRSPQPHDQAWAAQPGPGNPQPGRHRIAG